MWRRVILIAVASLAGALCLVAVLVIGHERAEQRSRLISAVWDMKDVYLHWTQGGRPLGQGLVARYCAYRTLYGSLHVWPSICTNTLSVNGRSEGCVFSWMDQKRVPLGHLVVTAEGRCYLLSEAGDAILLAEFEQEHAGLLDRPSGHYTMTSQQDGAANGSQPIRSETNRTSSAAGFRR